MVDTMRLLTATIALAVAACGPLAGTIDDATSAPFSTLATDLGTSCEFTPEQDFFGLNVEGWWADSDGSFMPLLAGSGARWARIVACFDADQEPGHPNTRALIDRLHAAGIKVLYIVGSAILAATPKPAWNASSAEWDPYRVAWLAEMERVAATLGPYVDAWEIFNEPDHQLPPGGYEPGVPADQFGWILRDVAPIIRRHGAGELVVGGLATGDVNYLAAAMTAAGGLAAYAGVGVHTYCPQGWGMDWVRQHVDTLYASYFATAGLPLWVTEAGGVAEPDENLAATYVQTIYQHTWSNHRERVKHLLYWVLSDRADGSEYFGLTHADGARRPGYDTYAALSPDYTGGACSSPGATAADPKSVRALRTERPLTAADVLASWDSFDTISLTTANYIAWSTASGSDQDISARVAVAWDASNLYLAARLTDDVHVTNPVADEMWRSDSLQVAIDADHDHTAGACDSDGDTQFGVAVTDSGPVSTRWVAPAGAPAWQAQVTAVQFVDGHLVVATVPLAVLGLTSPVPGRTVGFSVLVNDDDGSGREGWVEWTPGIGLGQDPAAYGDLVLGGGVGETTSPCTDAAACQGLVPSPACHGAWICNAAQRCEWWCTPADGGLLPVVDSGQQPAVDAGSTLPYDAGSTLPHDAGSTLPHDAGSPAGDDARPAIQDARTAAAADAGNPSPSRRPSDYSMTTSCDCRGHGEPALTEGLLLCALAVGQVLLRRRHAGGRR